MTIKLRIKTSNIFIFAPLLAALIAASIVATIWVSQTAAIATGVV